jgi:hypothetical protein
MRACHLTLEGVQSPLEGVVLEDGDLLHRRNDLSMAFTVRTWPQSLVAPLVFALSVFRVVMVCPTEDDHILTIGSIFFQL